MQNARMKKWHEGDKNVLTCPTQLKDHVTHFLIQLVGHNVVVVVEAPGPTMVGVFFTKSIMQVYCRGVRSPSLVFLPSLNGFVFAAHVVTYEKNAQTQQMDSGVRPLFSKAGTGALMRG